MMLKTQIVFQFFFFGYTCKYRTPLRPSNLQEAQPAISTGPSPYEYFPYPLGDREAIRFQLKWPRVTLGMKVKGLLIKKITFLAIIVLLKEFIVSNGFTAKGALKHLT